VAQDGVAAVEKRGGTLIFLDESGFSECPPLRRTWAPRGETPVVVSRGRSWQRMAAIGALAYRHGEQPRVFLRLHLGTVHSAEIVDFLRHLRRHVRGRVTLIWDGLNAHRSATTRNHIEAQRRWLRVVRLPAYAPELNPVEALWAWLKQGRLANTAEIGIDRLADRMRGGTRAGRRRPRLLHAFLAKAGLSL
jgi:transposase